MFPPELRGTLFAAALFALALAPAALFLRKTSRDDFALSGKIRIGPASSVFAAATEPTGTGEALCSLV
jgi:hypothetical protein